MTSTADGGHYQYSPSAVRAGKPDGYPLVTLLRDAPPGSDRDHLRAVEGPEALCNPMRPVPNVCGQG